MAPARELSLPEVQRLLEDMRAAIVGLAFQKALDSVRSKDWGALKKRAGVAKLLSFAWKAPLKASGFGINAHSFPQALAAVRAHASSPGVRSLSEEVEKLLKFFPGALFGSNAGKMKGTASSAALKEISGRGAFSKLSTGGTNDSTNSGTNGGANGGTNGSTNGGTNGGTSGRTESVSTPAPAPSMRPSALRGRPMGLGEAKDILKLLKEECAKPDFQEGLGDLSRNRVPDLQKATGHFVCKRWAEAMKFYDFPVTPGGFREMADGIQRCAYNRHVEMLAHEVEEKLHVPRGSFFGIAPAEDEGDEEEAAGGGAQTARPSEVSVLLRHNQLGTELLVNVPQGATFWDLKEAAARVLGSTDIKTRGRLVRKSPGGTFVSYKDSDPVGGVREVLVLGAELTPLGGGSSSRDVPQPTKPVANLRLNFDDMTLTQPRQQVPQASKAPELTKEQALQLLRELHAGYSDGDFQQRLKQFHATLGTTSQFSKERQRMALTVQSVVLPKYGMRGSIDGVLDMQKALGPFVVADPEMQKIAAECDELLLANARVKKKPKSESSSKDKVQPEPQEAPKAPAADPEPEPAARLESQKPLVPATEIYFVVKHARNDKDEEVWLKAMSSATFLQIKHVLAAKLGRDEVRTKGRLVYKDEGSGVWIDFPDEEELGRNRKVVHIMGVNMPSRESSLIVRHAIKDSGQVELRIWTHWKFREVREALGSKLGRADVKKHVKFVFKPNSLSAQGAWAAFKDEEQVGGTRTELYVLGVDDLEPAAGAKEAWAKEEEDRKKREEEEAEERERQKDRAEQARKAAEEQKEARRRAAEDLERQKAEQAELAKKAAEDLERRKVEDAQRKAKERKDKKIKEVAEEWERREREESERKAREEADRTAKEEAAQRRKSEAEQKAKEEAERQARQEEEAQRREREEAERKAKAEAERREKEEAERKAKEEAERRAVALKVQEENERRAAAAKEEAERKAREEEERRKQEEAARKAREEVARRAKEEEEQKAKEEAERKAKEEAERKAKEEERKAKQEAERKEKARQQAERKAEEEAKAKSEASRKAKEEADRKAKEEAARKAKEAGMKMKQASAPAPPPRLSQKEIVANMPAPTHHTFDPNEESKIWIVVGGEDKGGILVRKGEGYDSKAMPFRLSTGARVEEMEIVGNRFHYKRLYGDGPDFGWVNISLNEKVLLEPYELEHYITG